MEEKPYSLVSIRMWHKTREMLRRIQKEQGGTMVFVLHRIIEDAYHKAGLHTTE